MSRAKSINLFLMDGDASGRIKCTLANWTGVAYKIPRTEIEKCKNRKISNRSAFIFFYDYPFPSPPTSPARRAEQRCVQQAFKHTFPVVPAVKTEAEFVKVQL